MNGMYRLLSEQDLSCFSCTCLELTVHRSVTDTECEDLTCGHVSNDNDGSLLKPENVCFRFWSCFVVTTVAAAREIRLSAVGIIYNN